VNFRDDESVMAKNTPLVTHIHCWSPMPLRPASYQMPITESTMRI